MAKNINPALFIGLGGTGHKVLLQVKKSLLKNYGEKPPVTEILCFDTDLQELQKATQALTYINKSGNLVTENVKFANNESIGISVKSPDKLLKFEYIKSWLSERIAPKIGPSDTGARQIRQMGRFAIYENYNTQRIRDKINEKIRNLNDLTHQRNIDYQVIGKPRVHLIFSPCGGTGAGTFIDIVMIIRSIDPAIEIFGWLVMPDFYTSFPMTHSVVKNAYASLKEIDHLMGKDATSIARWSNYNKKPFEVDYTGNGTKFSLETSRFFEHVYLFDNLMENGKAILDIEDAYDRIGRILYLMVSGAGDEMQTVYSNNDDYNYPSSPETNGKRRNYSSMGISQIILDRNYLKKIKISQITKAILNAYTYSGNLIPEQELNTFIDANLWREDHGKDMVIDRLMPRNLLKYDIESLMPSKYKKECNLELKTAVSDFLNQQDTKIKNNCTKVKIEILDDFKNKLNEKLQGEGGYLKRQGGIAQSKQFLSFLEGAFLGMSDEMKNEVNSHESNRTKQLSDTTSYLESIISEENSFNVFGREKRIKEACYSYVQNSERVLLEIWQINRKNAANEFFNSAVVLITEKLRNLKDVESIILQATTDSERESQKLLNEIRPERDFERFIHNFYKVMIGIKDSDLNLPEAFNKIDFTSILNFRSSTDIINHIKKYAVDTVAVKSVDELSVETILQRLDKDLIKNIVEYLDSSSSTCIDIDAPSFLNNSGRTTMQKFGFICVENKDNTVFKEDGEVYQNIRANGGYSELKALTTGDKDTITMIKIAGMFPACSINRLRQYKDEFETSMINGGYHFSDRYFENAMDLFEGDDEDESFKWFVIGSALEKIYLYKGGIYLEYKEKEMKPLYSGNRGKTDRVLCSSYFMKQKEYVNYISNYYEKYFTEHGKPGIREKLINHYKNIETVEVLGKMVSSLDRESQEYKNIYKEKRIIKEFAMTNGIPSTEFGDE